ncbi:hypothetical protein EG68_06097, partial [Paragonimus skrjabini miyazakii]
LRDILTNVNKLHHSALLACSQTSWGQNLDGKTAVDLYYDRKAYMDSTISKQCMNNLTTEVTLTLKKAMKDEETNQLFVEGYRVKCTVNRNGKRVPELKAEDDLHAYEKFKFEIQSDFQNYWVPIILPEQLPAPVVIEFRRLTFGRLPYFLSWDTAEIDIFFYWENVRTTDWNPRRNMGLFGSKIRNVSQCPVDQGAVHQIEGN